MGEFLLLYIVCITFWYTIAHIDTYFEVRKKYIKPEYVKEFTFYRYTVDEIKRWLGR